MQDTEHNEASLASEATLFLTSQAFLYFRNNRMRGFAQRANNALERKTSRKIVTVVGEISRGKSALCNALMDAPHATPQGTSKTTNIPITLGPSSENIPAGKALLTFPSHSQLIDHGELENWVTQEKSGFLSASKEELPQKAYVAVDDSPLGDICVIDSPGIGGIGQRGHACIPDDIEVGVFIVVCDSSTPITAPEMDFIKKVSAENEKVIVAITKIDKNTSRYQEIALHDAGILESESGRPIQVQEVSSLLGSQPCNDRLRKLSKIDEFRNLLVSQFSHLELIPARNSLRITLSALETRSRLLSEQLESCKKSGETEAGLANVERQLQEARAPQPNEASIVRREVTRITQRVREELNEELEAIWEKWQGILNKQKLREIRTNAQYYSSLFTQDCETSVMKAQVAFRTYLQNDVITPRFGDDFPWAEFEDEITDFLFVKSGIDLPAMDEETSRQHQLVMGIGRTIRTFFISQRAALVTAIFSFGMANQQMWYESKKVLQQKMRQTLQRAGSTGFTSYESRVIEVATSFVTDQLKRQKQEKIERLESQEEELKLATKDNEKQRLARKKKIEAQLHEAERLQARAEELLTEINATIEDAS
ncbi:dynamin family protein [Corynebacterium pyruviciproducens]|uniref:dynamin family protein n=1 Tax=Corynebacterium pyruviciproducens TaxID=598660 RepID=UPI0024587135|nr:dynamin family protein [Corynebacterium pyruviciproducens]MDH4658666.1 dynamin family protein [Corynebacterium pyruviciproducens]